MLNSSELIYKQLVEITEKCNCDLFDAVIYFCEDNGIYPDELTNFLDKQTINILRQISIDNRYVRNKHFNNESVDITQFF